MKLPRRTLALVRGSIVAVSLAGCGGAAVSTAPADPPPVDPPQVAQVSAPVDPPIASRDNTTTSVSQSPEDYPVDCGRG